MSVHSALHIDLTIMKILSTNGRKRIYQSNDIMKFSSEINRMVTWRFNEIVLYFFKKTFVKFLLTSRAVLEYGDTQ